MSSQHDQAMDLAEQAAILKLKQENERAQSLLIEAFKLEQNAALELFNQHEYEPTRSILFRSAATLAFECNLLRDAEKLIAHGLSGNPPDELAEEMRDLLEQVNFSRHLKLRGVQLEPGELQLSITGHSVGFGIANTDEFISRVDLIEKLIQRTAERKLGHIFRERGPLRKNIGRSLETYVSLPRAASFAITIRIGSDRDQLMFPDPSFNIQSEIIDEVVSCLEIFQNDDDVNLKKKITDEIYYRNFIGLAKKIAPDGENVKLVGFTTVYQGYKKEVALTKSKKELIIIKDIQFDEEQRETKYVKISGELKYADSTQKKAGIIRLIDNQNKSHNIKVPPGMMNDIVKPLWEETVEVYGEKKGANILLIDINKI
jgi:hypothetical protein